MTLRLSSVGLVLSAALADATGHHALAYYSLVTAVPVVAVAALSGLGDVLDGSASEPHDRGIAMLTALALPFVLLALGLAHAMRVDEVGLLLDPLLRRLRRRPS